MKYHCYHLFVSLYYSLLQSKVVPCLVFAIIFLKVSTWEFNVEVQLKAA